MGIATRACADYKLKPDCIQFEGDIPNIDLTTKMIVDGVNDAYYTLEAIDEKLTEIGSAKLSELMELANLSAFIGNVIGGTLARQSSGKYERNRPHAYPDLIHISEDSEKGVEVKVALEKNYPKGHLPKPGFYLMFRYVLGSQAGKYTKGEREDTVWVWEIRFGELEKDDFSVSSTEGNSGKTAVIKTKKYNKTLLIYYDKDMCPYVRLPYDVKDKNQTELI